MSSEGHRYMTELTRKWMGGCCQTDRVHKFHVPTELKTKHEVQP